MYYIKLHEDPAENSRIIAETVGKIKENQKKANEIVRKQKKQDEFSSHLQFMIKTYSNRFGSQLLKDITKDFEESVKVCKEYAAEQKRLRTENRELMTILFKKN